MSELNSEFDCDISDVKSSVSWTKTQFDPDIIVGDEVRIRFIIIVSVGCR